MFYFLVYMWAGRVRMSGCTKG